MDKICTKCGKNGRGYYRRTDTWCKECTLVQNKKWVKAHIGKVKKYNKLYREKLIGVETIRKCPMCNNKMLQSILISYCSECTNKKGKAYKQADRNNLGQGYLLRLIKRDGITDPSENDFLVKAQNVIALRIKKLLTKVLLGGEINILDAREQFNRLYELKERYSL